MIIYNDPIKRNTLARSYTGKRCNNYTMTLFGWYGGGFSAKTDTEAIAQFKGIIAAEEEPITITDTDTAAAIIAYYDRTMDDHSLEWPDEYIGAFLCEEAGGWTAIDNTDGNAWTENFKSRAVAEMWLRGMYDTETALAIDKEVTA